MHPSVSPSQPSSGTVRPKRRVVRTFFIFVVVAVIGLAGYLGFGFETSHATTPGAPVKSGFAGYCLDNFQSQMATNNKVDVWECNSTNAQNWMMVGDSIRQTSSWCLTTQASQSGSAVALASCNDSPGQVWLRDRSGYFNPQSGFCLSASTSKEGTPVTLASCAALASSQETWLQIATNNNGVCSGTEGQKIACFAEKEWTAWQSGSPDHQTLLNAYTDGAADEAWCADFVSYVYKEAGYAFTNGSADGWDQDNANDVQYMGFMMHDPANYQPKPGDVAYFNYDGGHVELVVKGGKTPTFIYGNSATTDPATGNGQMQANTVTQDGDNGQLVYYLSPNGN